MIFGLTMFLSGRRISAWEVPRDLVPAVFSILLIRLSGRNTSEFEKEYNIIVQDIDFAKK